MRNVWLLAGAQALCGSASFLIVLLGGILGAQIAPRPTLATLPLSAMIVGMALTTIPAALAMQRFGRRPAFQASALFAACTAVMAAHAITTANFWLFCGTTAALGVNNAFVMQYRFAATEHVEPTQAGRAIASVMTGALLAAWLGPEIAIRAADLVEGARYAGSFYVAALMFASAALVLAWLPRSRLAAAATRDGARPLGALLRQPTFVVAVMAGLAAYAVMSFIMTATPVSMHVIDHHAEHDTKWVIQSHLMAMYLPSLVSGRIVVRLGIYPTMVVGTLAMAGCVLVAAFAGHAVIHYWWAMVLLGVGWNLLFVSGSTLLTRTYRPGERFRAQAVNEFVVFGSQAVASLLAGVALATIGWEALNLASVPMLLAVLAGVAYLVLRREPSPA